MKRRFSRIPISNTVEFFWQNESHKGVLKNLSYGGSYILSEIIPPLGEEIPIILFLKGAKPSIKLFFKGKVVRTNKDGFAIKYTYISPESFEHFKNFISYHYPSPEIAEKEFYRFLGEAHPLFKSFISLNILTLKNEILKYLLERAFLYSPEKPFILSSGKESPYYLDCRKVTLYSPAFSLIGALFWQKIKYLGVEGVAGMSIGADPIVCAILSKANEENLPLEGLLIRKEPKKYGTQKQIEGNIKEEMSVVLVEDVVTTGGSVLKAAEILEKERVEIIKIFALIDREEGGRKNIEAKGYEFEAFFTLGEIIEKYQELSNKKY
ncbi:MAG: orotate phosphoribosyltransferase [Thermodesulfobacterium geofontis]|uniref:Orotate phosphoribosyltransferase n=1 Tax=Thermodesulfobacterium geofontis TaxID=1295609 RepID=A0A2N7PQC2_9BACT|nr:MAG: orotate phosphoribosyltransferase [Thermodesulfobacterium geofontis]